MSSTRQQQIGEAVRQARGDTSQAELAEWLTARLDYTVYQNTLTLIETGRRPLRLEEAVVIAETLGVSLDFLAGHSSRTEQDLLARSQRLERFVMDIYLRSQEFMGDPFRSGPIGEPLETD